MTPLALCLQLCACSLTQRMRCDDRLDFINCSGKELSHYSSSNVKKIKSVQSAQEAPLKTKPIEYLTGKQMYTIEFKLEVD